MLTSFALALTLFQDKALPDAKMGQVQLVMLMEGNVQKLSGDEETK